MTLSRKTPPPARRQAEETCPTSTSQAIQSDRPSVAELTSDFHIPQVSESVKPCSNPSAGSPLIASGLPACRHIKAKFTQALESKCAHPPLQRQGGRRQDQPRSRHRAPAFPPRVPNPRHERRPGPQPCR